MAHALSDDQVSKELKKMVAFIRQEALEKAREISIKADEEFAIEKSKLVRTETLAIDAQYERKFKQAELSQQIARSNVTNKTRLKVLAARQQLLDDIFDQARGKLAEISKDEAGYEEILKNLVLECVYALDERRISVRVREKDVEVSKRAVEKAKGEYKGELEVEIEEWNWLPAESHGGIYMISGSGKISINNTLEERLKLLESEALPAVRASVFGQNPNRKFYD
ncbi:ATPase, V1/A1 complex, subunit E [Choiromyces venosus 120613-1]|uniref:ATPase, V1/A1 complex, subunit E n=1 Tax=Choiromyces venosus 120613-1 TaxID=1336337 RepID=A0A3N4JTW1_9PEZI|nr:ATPase, V1/A1 complex, subunit E [Choiromyces venosus 120613-1]